MNSKRFRCLTICISLFLLIVISGCGREKPEPPTITLQAQKPVTEPEPARPEAEIAEEVQQTESIAPQERAEPDESGANLALQFTTGDVTTYHVAITDTQEVKWEGSVPDNSKFKDGKNYNKVEMKFRQEIIDVNANGDALASITIEGLKYQSIVRDETIINYDSTNPRSIKVLNYLIGRSYTIKIHPNGNVDVVDTSKMLTGLRKSPLSVELGKDLMKQDNIQRRHGLLILPDADQNPIRNEEQWSQTNTYSFGLMGTSVYEREYTLKDIEEQDGVRVALVLMEGIPSAEIENPSRAVGMAQMFDTQEKYAGQLKFDLDNGNVEEYVERLNVQWVAIMPANNQDKKPPPVLKMIADRSYYLKKID